MIKAKPPRIKLYMLKLHGSERAGRNIFKTEEINVDINDEYIEDFLSKLRDRDIQFEAKTLIVSAQDSVQISSKSFTKLVCIFTMLTMVVLYGACYMLHHWLSVTLLSTSCSC